MQALEYNMLCLSWSPSGESDCNFHSRENKVIVQPKSCSQSTSQIHVVTGTARRHSGSWDHLSGHYSSSDISTGDDDRTSLSDDACQSAISQGADIELPLGQASTLRRMFSSPDLRVCGLQNDLQSLSVQDTEPCCPLNNNSVVNSPLNCLKTVNGNLENSPATKDTILPSSKPILETSSTLSYPLLPSLFMDIPPTLRFFLPEEEDRILSLPLEVRRVLLWKLSSITPVLIRQTVCRSGYRLTRKNRDWVALWGKHIKSLDFQDIKDFQKVNHFPGSHNLGRKDNLLHHLKRCNLCYGSQLFDFLPETFILPKDIRALKQAWGQHWWIIKPPASARGSGIYLVHKWSQVPKKQATIVQRYIPDPYLINGTKFDLRLYVLVSTFNPLRIYVYRDGLVRFASMKYSTSVSHIGERFIHLTNYSINKKHAEYNANQNGDCYQGHKWTLRNFWRYLREEKGVDTEPLWKEMTDMIVKTVISAESGFSRLIACHVASRYSCYELFGFDILLDSHLKPWLLEVNISPSLHSASELDATIKGELVRDMLNLVGFHIPGKVGPSVEASTLKTCGLSGQTRRLCLERYYYYPLLSPEDRLKHQLYEAGEDTCSILDDLTPDDCRHLMQGEDELNRCGGFLRLFPCPGPYLSLFRTTRYYNLLLDSWEKKYGSCRQKGIALLQEISRTGFHLKGVRKKLFRKALFLSNSLEDSEYVVKITPKNCILEDFLNDSHEEIVIPTLEVSHSNPLTSRTLCPLAVSRRQPGKATFRVPSRIRLNKGDTSVRTPRSSLVASGSK